MFSVLCYTLNFWMTVQRVLGALVLVTIPDQAVFYLVPFWVFC